MTLDAHRISDDEAKTRQDLADAAWRGDWPTVFDLVAHYFGPNLYEPHVNCVRIGGTSWYTPLHQAAWHGAAEEVVRRLVRLGAWRTLRNARGERPLDIARRRNHRHLLKCLVPDCKRDVSEEVLLGIQRQFHALIRRLCGKFVDEHKLRLPELDPLLELDDPKMYFRVWGTGYLFGYRLEADGAQTKLISESNNRFVEASELRHEITSTTSKLVASGFWGT